MSLLFSRNTVFYLLLILVCQLVRCPDCVLAQENPGLEAKYQELSKEILEKLRAEKIKSTGVLKFSVRIGDGDFPSSLGALNMRLAEKLEIALAMANPAMAKDSDKLIGICRAATDVAASIKGANHLTTEGRKALFTQEFPLAFKIGDRESLVPDSLIAGVAQIHEDLSQMDIELALVTRSNNGLQPLASFTVPTDLEDLIDAGESFSTRGIHFSGSTISQKLKGLEKVKEQARKVRNETLSNSKPQQSDLHPLASNSNSPIKFEVWYDNQVQPIEFRNGAAFVKEPRQGQKVLFVVRRKGTDQTRYGVLVKVNGENTLYRERKPDAKSSVWIFRPDTGAFSIRGFQIDKDTRQDFVVLSDKASRNRAVDYGRDVGMINLVVYQEAENEDLILDEDLEMQQLQSQVALPEKTAESRGQLAKTLFAQLSSQNSTRGLITEGAETEAKVKTVTFRRDLTPVVVASIRYYSN